MMQQLALSEFLADVSARKAQLGFDEGAEALEAHRNKGGRRTARKLLILQRTEQRARVAGREPVVSYS